MSWNRIGENYYKMLRNIISTTPVKTNITKYKSIESFPRFNLSHISRLTDDTGILEHANYSVPDFKEGYCLDDNARALLLVLTAYESGVDKQSIGLADTYLRYIKLMQKDDGFFHNDLSYDKRFLDETGSEDAFGRTIWAIGYLIRLAPNDSHFQFAKDIFFRSFPNFEHVKSIRAIANIIIGLCNFLKRYADNERVMQVLNILSNKLIAQYNDESDVNWKWFEPVLCYENALLPLALWYAYEVTRNKQVYAVANESTQFLTSETCLNEHITLVGNTWYHRGELKTAGGQQPIDAMALVLMHQKAFLVTRESAYRGEMLKAFSWFLGNNDLFIPLYDAESNGCCDGLEQHSVNRNQGAESTISYHLAYLTVWVAEEKMILPKAIAKPKTQVLNNVISIRRQPTAKAR
jgi:hypothetical protein